MLGRTTLIVGDFDMPELKYKKDQRLFTTESSQLKKGTAVVVEHRFANKPNNMYYAGGVWHSEIDLTEMVIPTGTIIQGTLLIDDLITAFCDFIVTYHPKGQDAVNMLFEDYKVQELAVMSDLGMNEVLQEYIYPFMDTMSPPGHFFGLLPSDGSDFGYWPLEIDEGGDNE